MQTHSFRCLILVTVLALSGAFGGCASAPATRAPSPSSAPEAPLRVIDAHMHTRFTGQPERTSGIIQTKENLLKEMAENGVVGGIVHTGETGGGYEDLSANGIIDCAGVGARVDTARVEEGLKSGKYRCIKIYLGYVHQYAYDRHYEPAYRLASKYKVPVVFHTGDTYSTKGKLKFADPLTIDEVAVDHPDVNFVIAHLGNPWIASAAEVAYKNPNVYLDGSALLIGDLDATDPASVEKLVVEPISWLFRYLESPNKLMYGTDWPLTKMGPYLKAFKRAIPREHWNAVFHDNAVRVFKLSEPLLTPAK